MKKINILRKNEDFSRMIQNGRPYKYRDYVVYVEKTGDDTSHFGISIGKKIGNAVTRNHIKRQIKNIIDKKPYQKGINCIIIVRKSITEKSFIQIEDDLTEVMGRLHILEETR